MIIDQQIRDLVAFIESEDVKDRTPLDKALKELILRLHQNCQKPEAKLRYRGYDHYISETSATKTELSSYPIDGEGYAIAIDPLQEEERFWEFWSRFGLVVDKSVISSNTCNVTINRIHVLAAKLSNGKFAIDAPESHQFNPTDANGTLLVSRGFFEVYHDDSLAQLRQAVRIYIHHVLLWGRADLWTTFDRYGVKLAGHKESKGLPLHVDQNATVHADFTTIQGVLALTDCPSQRGTFVAVPRSKYRFHHYADIVKAGNDGYKGEYVELDLKQPFAKELEDHAQVIPIRAGDLVSWDSRTTHANSANISGEPRVVAYISAGPSREQQSELVEARNIGFASGLGSNIRMAMMHASKKPRFTDSSAVLGVRQPEQFNLLGQLLYGQKRYQDYLFPTLSSRLLLNAESFAFGPTAAIADFFPILRKHFAHIAFIGSGQTLDLQSDLPYDQIYDLDDLNGQSFDEIVSQYDVFFTALDFKKATRANQQGVATIIYDPLTWYWQDIPQVVNNDGVMYLAQDFIGVRERTDSIPNAKVVPPIIPNAISSGDKDIILINLGGLKNPYWPKHVAIDYARVILTAIEQALPAASNIVIATNKEVEEALNDPRVKNYSREEIKEMLPRVKFAVITPGLSNIYDVSRHRIPSVFLPPANDSQALQACLLKTHGMVDAMVDWADLQQVIDYHCGDQDKILSQIAHSIGTVLENEPLKQELINLFSRTFTLVASLQKSKTSLLVEQYGTGGVEDVANAVYEFAKRNTNKATETAESDVNIVNAL